MPGEDEFGIPIKTQSSANVDEFGIPLKKKTSNTGSSDASTGGTPIFSQYPSSSDRPSGFTTAGGNTKPTSVAITPPELTTRVPDPSFSDMLNQPNVLDHDIAANSVLSLGAHNNAPKDPTSLQGFNQSQQSLAAGSLVPSFSETATHKAAEIKNDPDALWDYRKTRLDDLDNQIKQLEATKQPTVGYLETGQRISTEVLPVDDQINELKKYKEDLHKSVADAALIAVPKKIIGEGKDLNIEDVGRRYLETIGDPTVSNDKAVLNTSYSDLNPRGETKFGKLGEMLSGTNEVEADKNAFNLTSETIRNKFYQQGAASLSAYHLAEAEKIASDRSVKINDFLKIKEELDKDPAIIQNRSAYNAALKDPDIQQYVENATKAVHYHEEAATSSKYYPQVARQELRQTLNDKFFDLVTKKDEATNKLSLITPLKLVAQTVFGETPSEQDVAQLAKETGKPIDEVRDIVNTPVSGMFATAPQGVRVSGLATGVSQAVDETLATSINGLRRIFNTNNVDAKNALLQTKSDAYNMGASQNSLYDKYGHLNFNPYSIANMSGRGVGQMAVFAAPSMVTGGLAEGLAAGDGLWAAATRKSVPALTTIASGYIGSYEPAYKEVASHTDNEETRRGYANFVALANAVPELFLSPAEIAAKVGVGKPTKEALIKSFIKDAEKMGTEAAFVERLAKGAANAGEVVLGENIEEQATNIATNKADEVYLNKVKTAKELADQFIQTVVSTTVNMLPMAIGGGVSGYHDAGGSRREALFEAGNNPEETKAALQAHLDNGIINQEQFNTRASIVNQMHNIVANLPKENIHGEPLSYEQKSKLAAAQYRVDLNKKLEEKSRSEGGIAAQADLIKADTEAAIEEQKQILTTHVQATATGDSQGQTGTTTQESQALPSNESTAPQEATAQAAATGEISDAEIKPTFDKVLPYIIPEQDRATAQGVIDRVNDAEYINEKDINAATDVLYGLLDKLPQESHHLIEPLINKLESYEFTTKTETRNVTETVPTQVARPARATAPVNKSLSQWEGSRATVTDSNGKQTEGYLKSDNGTYYLYDNDGNKTSVLGEKAITDRDVTLPEDVPSPFEFGEDGNIKSITVQLNKLDKESGDISPDKRVTIQFKDADKAMDYAIQLRAEQVGEVPQPEFDTVFQQVEKQVQEEVLKNKPNESQVKSTQKPAQKADAGTPVNNEPVTSAQGSNAEGTTAEAPQTTKQNSVTPNIAENASNQSQVPQQEVPQSGGERQHARTSPQQNQTFTQANDSNSPVGSQGKPKEKVSRTKASKVLRDVADRAEKGILPSWAKATLPNGTQAQGFGEKELSGAIAKALRLTADAIDKGAQLADAVNSGLNDLLGYYKANGVGVDEDALRKGFEQEVKSNLKKVKQQQQANAAKKTVNKSANRSYANFTVRMADLLNSDRTLTPEQIIKTLGKVTDEQKRIIYEQYDKRRSKEEAGLAATKKWVGDLFDAIANGSNISKSAFNIAKSDFAHVLDLVADKFIEYKVVSNRKLEKFADKAIELFKDDYVAAIDFVERADKLGEAKPILLAKLAVKLDEAGKAKDAAKVMQKLIATATFTARTLQSFNRVNEILNVKGSPQYKTELAKKIMDKAKELSDARVQEVEEDFRRQLGNNEAEIKKYKDKLDAIRNKAHRLTLSSVREKMEELVNKICNTRRK